MIPESTMLPRRLIDRVRAAWAPETVTTIATDLESSRTYRVVARRDHASRPVPVLVALHGYATEADVLVRAYQLVRLAVEKRGWILVVPEGIRDQVGHRFWNATVGCCATGSARPDDLGYLERVLQSVQRMHHVDAARVYAIGVSNGGFMAHRWACAARGGLRAIASISGVGPGPDDAPCEPVVPVSVLQIHGSEDGVIRYEGGLGSRGRYPSVRDSTDVWRRLAAADAVPRTEERHSILLGRIRVQTWRGASATVSLWTVEGGGHHFRLRGRMISEVLDFLEGRQGR